MEHLFEHCRSSRLRSCAAWVDTVLSFSFARTSPMLAHPAAAVVRQGSVGIHVNDIGASEAVMSSLAASAPGNLGDWPHRSSDGIGTRLVEPPSEQAREVRA